MKSLRCIGINENENENGIGKFSLGCVYPIIRTIYFNDKIGYIIEDDEEIVWTMILDGCFYKFELVEV